MSRVPQSLGLSQSMSREYDKRTLTTKYATHKITIPTVEHLTTIAAPVLRNVV